jgi:uncharacterized protein (DUF433 family)
MGQLVRIVSDPTIFGGKPTVRGMRISVELILSLLAQGETQESILDDYPGLQPEDIRACLAYAHAVVANDRLDDVRPAASASPGHPEILEPGKQPTTIDPHPQPALRPRP